MNCFHHPDRAAVTLCKACLKGLCADCLVEVAPGSACRGECETWVRSYNETVRKSLGSHQRYATLYRGLSNLFFSCCPAVVALYVLSSAPDQRMGSLMGGVIYAVPMLVGGLWFRRWASKLNPK